MKYLSILLCITVVVVCLCLSGCGGSHAQTLALIDKERQSVAFLHDYATGLETARLEKKPALVFFAVSDNVGSQRMMETTFTDDEIKRLSERLVCIHVDAVQETTLCETLKITSFPTIVLFNANGMEIRRLAGRQTPDQLAVQIHVLLQAMAARSQATTGR